MTFDDAEIDTVWPLTALTRHGNRDRKVIVNNREVSHATLVRLGWATPVTLAAFVLASILGSLFGFGWMPSALAALGAGAVAFWLAGFSEQAGMKRVEQVRDRRSCDPSAVYLGRERIDMTAFECVQVQLQMGHTVEPALTTLPDDDDWND